MVGPITSETHTTIKQQIHSHLKEHGVFTSLKSIINSALREQGEPGEGQGNARMDLSALTAAQRASVLARIVADKTGRTPPHLPSDTRHTRSHTHAHLHVLLLGGRAFSHTDIDGGRDSSGDRGSLRVCLQFAKQRFNSVSVPFADEPEFRDGVLFELPPPDDATAAAATSAGLPAQATMEMFRGLCRTCEPMHVVVLHQVGGREVLLSSCLLEWRQVLYHGRQTLSVELPGLGTQSTLLVGSLEIKLELVPQPQAEACMTEAEVMLLLKKERDLQVDAERRFFAYARNWWAQYVDLNPDHATRAVKLFAMSEFGTQRPVTAFVRPLRAERLLETPRQAAHFVSLLRHSREPSAGAVVADVWRSMHATLAVRAGEAEEHALMLCSLLLGFRLDAYVCIGTDVRGTHAWVMTRTMDGHVTFWESLTGQQYLLPGAHPYTSLACVFSHETLYANVQTSTSLESTSLDLADPHAWKPMEVSILRTITPIPMAHLRPSTLSNAGEMAHDVERRLCTLVNEHREGLGLPSASLEWDSELACLLEPALASYETERASGHPVGAALFADAIRRAVPQGHTFKGFPHHFLSADATIIFDTWLRDEVALGIVQCRASKARFAVRLRVQPMPDDVVSVWAMLAITYRPD